ncbi:hypothetical protein RIF29_36913 [Crotalaria pallida]|uniref:BHLH domain-containing protein n=1 Tax=Crotalaria pallida TaxID=3830 RepID=A0AAN9HSJ2_CROPI
MTSTEEESWTSWLCDLDAEDYNFINESILNVVEGSFPSHNNDVENSESHISYATFNTDNSSTMSNSSGDDNNNNNITSFERPTKVLKTSTTTTSNNTATSDIAGYLSQKDSSPSSYILSFDNNVNPEPIMILNTDPGKVVNNKPLKGSFGNYQLKEQTKRNVQEGKKSGIVNRSPHQAQDHIIAERMRRERISHQFIALSALIPGLKKMDKATVLGDAIKHVKRLQEQVKVLEEEAKKRRAESVVYVEKSSQVFPSEDVSDTSSNYGDCDTSKTSSRSLPEVEARVSQKNVLIRIHCENKKGVVVNILKEIEKLHLSVINSSALLFGTSVIDITVIAQMDDEFSLSLKELARNLRVGLSQLM